MGEDMINKIILNTIYILKLFWSVIVFRWRFGKCGKRVVFGRVNRIVGARNIEIGDYCTFGNNLRLEAITRYGGVNLVLILE